MEYFFYAPCIREWPFDFYVEQEDYPGSKILSTSFSLYKPRSNHLILSRRGSGRFGGDKRYISFLEWNKNCMCFYDTSTSGFFLMVVWFYNPPSNSGDFTTPPHFRMVCFMTPLSVAIPGINNDHPFISHPWNLSSPIASELQNMYQNALWNVSTNHSAGCGL